MMSRKLKDVGTIEAIEASDVLELPSTQNDFESEE